MTEKFVLIVENEDKLRGLMEKIVSLEGYQVLEIADPRTEVLPCLTVFDPASDELARPL